MEHPAVAVIICPYKRWKNKEIIDSLLFNVKLPLPAVGRYERSYNGH